MSKLSDQVAYLRGLAAGMKLSDESDEGRLLREILQVLGTMSEEIGNLQDDLEDLSDYVESIDDDLGEMESVFEPDDDEDGEDDDDYPLFDDDDDDDDCPEDDEGFAVYGGRICPECHGMFSADERDDPDQMYICPHCGKRVRALPLDDQQAPVAETADDPSDEK